MATMNISLPDKMKKFVEEQVATGNFANASDYMREIIRRDQQRRAENAWLEKEIEAGYASGLHEGTLDELFASVKDEAAKQLALRRKSA
jgi:antitoxin ParD1/3/4